MPNLKYCTMEMVVLEAAVGACAPVVGYRDSVSVYSCRAPVGPVHGVFIRTAVIGHSTVDEREDAGCLVNSVARSGNCWKNGKFWTVHSLTILFLSIFFHFQASIFMLCSMTLSSLTLFVVRDWTQGNFLYCDLQYSIIDRKCSNKRELIRESIR